MIQVWPAEHTWAILAFGVIFGKKSYDNDYGIVGSVLIKALLENSKKQNVGFPLHVFMTVVNCLAFPSLMLLQEEFSLALRKMLSWQIDVDYFDY